MAWTVGDQKPRKNTLISNKEILEKKGFLDEREAKLLFYQFLRNNVTFATDLLCDTTLLPFQHIMIKSMLESDYFLGVISRGGSKSWSAGIYAYLDAVFNQGIQIGILSSSFRQCLEENEYVLCESGLKKIKDVSVGEKLFAKDGLQKVLNKWSNEPSKGIQIKTRRGYNLSGKPEHKVLTYNPSTLDLEYKELKDLAVGDCLPISINDKSEGSENLLKDIEVSKPTHRESHQFNKPEENDDFYYFLGQIIGDGHFSRETKNGRTVTRVGLTSADDETLVRIQSYLKSLVPESLCTIKPNKLSRAKNILSNCAALGDFIENFGYKPNTRSPNKEIPEKVFSAKKKFQAAFISGLLDSDGTFGEGKCTASVKLSTFSFKMAKQYQLLLSTFGLVSTIYEAKEKGWIVIKGYKTFANKFYEVRIHGYENVKLFYDKIGFKLTRKQQLLENYVKNNKATRASWGIPGARKYFSDKYYKKLTGVEICHLGVPTSKSVSKDRLASLLNKDVVSEEDKAKIKILVESNFFFDILEDKKETNDITTIDIEVSNEHCYWGNGFINHNSKLLFRKIEDLASRPGAYLMRQAITKIQHSSDSWILEAGRSRIIALPLGDGEKLRGYRFNRIIIDEFLLMPERIVTEVVMPFLAVNSNPVERKNLHDLQTKLIAQGEMTEEDRYEWPSNKLIALSSASYKFENLYKYYQQLEKLILNPKVDEKTRRCIIQLSCDALPQQLYDGNQIQQARATMSDAQFSREYGAQFTNESDGFFSVQKMLACTVPDGEQPCVEAYGNPNDEYIIGLDSSWAESETSDSFAIQVVKLLPEKKSSVLVHSYEIPGMALKDHISYFHYLLTNFNVVSVCMDMNGGLTFMSACNESECFKNSGIHLKPIETKFDKAEEYNANLISGRNEYNKTTHRYVIQRIPTSQWIRTANELMQANLDNKKIYFASMAMDEEFRRQTKKNIGISNLKYKRKSAEEESIENVDWDTSEGSVSDTKNKALMIDFLEHLHDTIQLTKTQLAMIVPTTTIQGTQSFDLPKNVKGSGRDRARKDSYSAILLANWAVKIYFDMLAVTVEETDSTFTPMMI